MAKIKIDIPISMIIYYKQTPDGPELWTYLLPTDHKIYKLIDENMEEIKQAIIKEEKECQSVKS